MCGVRAFKDKRPSDDSGQEGRTEGNASEWVTPIIEQLYKDLLEYDFSYDQLYDMTVEELMNTLIGRRKGLGYTLWKQAVLIGMTFGKNFPKTPEKASPELYPRKKTIKMPPNLLKKELAKRGGKINYE